MQSTALNKADSQRDEALLYTIGEAADLLGIAAATLRMYEREGLVIPIKRPSGHRLFTGADIARVRCIREAIITQRISIAGIRHILALIPCWILKPCPPEAQHHCLAYTQQNSPCWSLTNRPWECASADCRVCHVYTNFVDCRSIKRAIVDLTKSRLNQKGTNATA